MRKSLELINSKGDSIPIGYQDPYFLTGFDAGGIPKVTIYTSKSINQDGETYVSSTANMRNIIIDFDITSEFMYSKQRLYQVFRMKEKHTLVFRHGDIERKINCYVESLEVNETDIDKKRVQVSLLCPNPYWSTLNTIITEIALWLGLFEFELEFSEDGIDFGTRTPSLVVNVLNEGHVECGMIIYFKALATVVNPKLYDIYQQKWVEIDYTMIAGDIIKVDTDEMDVKLIRGGVTTDITNYLTYESDYLKLAQGDNLLRYSSEENQDNLEIKIYFNPLFSGV